MIGKCIAPDSDTYIEEIENTSSSFDFIEIAIGEAELDIEEIDKEKLKKTLKDKNFDIIIHLPFRQPLITEIEAVDKSLTQYYDKLLKFSEELNAEKAVIHANIRHHLEPENNLEDIKKQLNEINRIGEKHGIEICIENVNIGYINGIELSLLGEILEEENLSMCFDIGHAFNETDQEDVDEFVEEYSEIISHLHVQDTRENDDLHLPLGVGEIDFQILEEVDNATFCLEIFTDDSDYVQISHKRLSKLID